MICVPWRPVCSAHILHLIGISLQRMNEHMDGCASKAHGEESGVCLLSLALRSSHTGELQLLELWSLAPSYKTAAQRLPASAPGSRPLPSPVLSPPTAWFISATWSVSFAALSSGWLVVSSWEKDVHLVPGHPLLHCNRKSVQRLWHEAEC